MKKISVSAFAFLLLTVASMTYAQPACCPVAGQGTDLFSEFTPDQQKKFTQMQTDYLKKIESIRSDMGKKRIEYLEAASKDKVDEAALEKIREDFMVLQDGIRKEGRTFAAQIRSLLTPEQKEKLVGPGMGLGCAGCPALGSGCSGGGCGYRAGGGSCCKMGSNTGGCCGGAQKMRGCCGGSGTM